ncbi:MAG: hypothetical protein GVY30_07790, partial [Chloroflexi bacterium]|nr:hypothetical protein [Chloroflexota bacterium]
MYSKGFLRSVLNLVVVVSLLVGLLPLKVRAASVTEEPTVEPSPQAPTADYEIYLP